MAAQLARALYSPARKSRSLHSRPEPDLAKLRVKKLKLKLGEQGRRRPVNEEWGIWGREVLVFAADRLQPRTCTTQVKMQGVALSRRPKQSYRVVAWSLRLGP